ncbi:MAG TPA: ABC transporter substrate-binding protein [Ideonella sp.]|uniref:ABC transporter substrate-binding protein n=1 Tax=Ideonella sp. TaxID=1929293 RepID=UPI002E37B375|nr:ABC transporter substrate-binding protein [Ideonella sp.]HEX5683745.1 ABC transporter substrate-binding protein [Ideonella sp.]
MTRHIRRAITALALGLPLAAAAQLAPGGAVRIGVEGAYPPFSQVGADGQLKGFDIDIAHALCEQMKARCTLVQQDFDGMIPALNARKFDAIVASLSITEERKKAVAFSDKYYKTPNRVIIKAGSGLVVSPEGLKGKRIGVQRATINDRFATDTFKHSEIVRYAKQDDIYLDLAAGRLDATLVDAVAADAGFLKRDQGKGFVFAGPAYTDPAYFGHGVGVAVRRNDPALLQSLNVAIAAIRANGTYQKLQDKYFDFDIYGDAAAAQK